MKLGRSPQGRRLSCVGSSLRDSRIATLLALVALSWATPSSAAANLGWESGPGYRHAKVTPVGAGKTGFTLLPGETTGVRWTNFLAVERYLERQNLMNGAGVAAGDFDNDGWCDLYFCNKQGPNALFRNIGQWRFEDVAARAGVACTNQSSTGATFADINGDGRLDLLVTSFTGPNACFLNLGEGRFTNITQSAGLISKGGTTSMALGDLDGNGDLDLYVCYFAIEALLRDGSAFSIRETGGKAVVTGRYAKRLSIVNGRVIEFGEPDMLFRNEGQGQFTPREWNEAFVDEEGKPMSAPRDFGLAVQIRDINGDGDPDIYVCNDFQTPDRLWLNQGKGRFRAAPRLALRTMSYASMGVDFADIDRDGRLDFFTVEMLSREHTHHLRQMSPLDAMPRTIGAIEDREEVARNALYWNRGDGTYAEIAFFAGLAATDWSWTPVFLDVDLDGYEDLLVSNGHLHDVNDRDVTESRPADPAKRSRETRQILLRYPRLDTPNAAYRNRGDLTFEDTGAAWGFNSRKLCYGVALADLDNDGDLDVVVNCVNDAPLIYRNDTLGPRVAVRLKGNPPNTQGIGAKLKVLGGPLPQSQEIICGGRYLSGDDPMRVFAVGTPTNELTIEVIWRSGKRSFVTGAKANRIYEIDESSASSDPAHATRNTQHALAGAPTIQHSNAPTLFDDVSQLLPHSHHEDPFDDFARQPLLPRRFSQLGPGVAWFDLNGDGHDDLIIGSGRGDALAVYHGDGKGGFTRVSAPALGLPVSDDVTGVVGWSAEKGKAALLVGLASYETAAKGSPAVIRYDFAEGTASAGASLPANGSSTGPLAMADIDGDGDLDLFVGGRLIAGRYPEPASSRIFRNKDGQFVLDAENSRLLAEVGLVSGAVFSDLTGDGLPELILACEWGPIRIFRNDRGLLKPGDWSLTTGETNSYLVPHDSSLSQLTGWWTSVATGDLDGDGRLDLVVGNWGLNSSFQRAARGPWSIFYGDLTGDGHVSLLEAYFNTDLQRVVPWRDMKLISQDLPWIREAFPSHQAYAQASITSILGDRLARCKELRAQTHASLVFFNRGKSFEAVALPREAQWAPLFSLNIADLDGDGDEDIFLSQNFFAGRIEDNRLDAGLGLWLLGDGHGKLTPVPASESGVKVYGEQRGAALADFDEDSRVDLVVTQNGAATKLYRNVGAKPGLRVRLAGPKNNPRGLGAMLRLGFGSRQGAAREVRAGSGYWSQDSAVQVLGMPEEPSSIWIRWPGGKETTGSIPKGAKEITADAAGQVTVVR